MRHVPYEMNSGDGDIFTNYGDDGTRLSALDVPLALTHDRYDGEEVDRINLFARAPELGAQVFLHVYPPTAEGIEAWQEELDSYASQEVRFKLPAGEVFDEAFMAPAATGFRSHRVSRVRDSVRARRQRIVHAFEGEHRRVLLVWSLDGNGFSSVRFF